MSEAQQVPLVELLRSVPKDARLVIEDGPYSTQYIPVGRYCDEAAEALSAPSSEQAQPWPMEEQPDGTTTPVDPDDLRASEQAQQGSVPVVWQYRPIAAPTPGEWRDVVPAHHDQTLEQRLEELLAYRYDHKPCYEVRALYDRPAAAAPMIQMDAEGQHTFAKAILDPPQPNAAMQKAEENYSRLIRPAAAAPADPYIPLMTEQAMTIDRKLLRSAMVWHGISWGEDSDEAFACRLAWHVNNLTRAIDAKRREATAPAGGVTPAAIAEAAGSKYAPVLQWLESIGIATTLNQSLPALQVIVAALTTAARAAEPERIPDYCTDPDNCTRCKTHPDHRGDMEHAGIGKRPPWPPTGTEKKE